MKSLAALVFSLALLPAAQAQTVPDWQKKWDETLKAAKVRPAHVEGYDRAEWVLMDYFTFIVHIFTPQTRAFYSLERLWGDAERIEVSDDPKADAGGAARP